MFTIGEILIIDMVMAVKTQTIKRVIKRGPVYNKGSGWCVTRH